MTLNAHVPARTAGEIAASAQALASPMFLLGARLQDLGKALQRAETTIGELTAFAEASGLSISIKVVEGAPRADEG